MEQFLLSERHRLELHWEKVIYEQKGVCKLVNAYFSGPALQIAQKVLDNDYMRMDFCKQYYILTKNVYVTKLSWGKVVYNKGGTIILKDAMVTHDTKLYKAPKFKNTDYVVIDTKDHEMEVHQYNFVYASYVIDRNGVLYKF